GDHPRGPVSRQVGQSPLPARSEVEGPPHRLFGNHECDGLAISKGVFRGRHCLAPRPPPEGHQRGGPSNHERNPEKAPHLPDRLREAVTRGASSFRARASSRSIGGKPPAPVGSPSRAQRLPPGPTRPFPDCCNSQATIPRLEARRCRILRSPDSAVVREAIRKCPPSPPASVLETVQFGHGNQRCPLRIRVLDREEPPLRRFLLLQTDCPA